MTQNKRDAREVPIEVGATVIYGAPVGRSIALVEGVVDGFTDSGRVWVKIVRRAYGGGWADSKSRVHVGPDRLVIVTELPHSDLPTEADARAAAVVRGIAYHKESIALLESGDLAVEDPGESLAYHRRRLAELSK